MGAQIMVVENVESREPRVVQANMELIRVLGDLHRFVNERFFGGQLPQPIITLSGEGRSRKGYFHPGRWMQHEGMSSRQAQENEAPDEIMLHSELALAGDFLDMAAVFMHQIAHQAQEHLPDQYGDPSVAVDTGSHYHNKAWHWLMQEKLGLRTEGPKGETAPGPMFRAIMREFPAPRTWLVRAPSETKAPTKMLLWRCRCTRVRCAVPLDATCNKCKRKFRQQ